LSVLSIIYRQHDRSTAGEVAAGGQPDPTAGAGVQWSRWAANSRLGLEDDDPPTPSVPSSGGHLQPGLGGPHSGHPTEAAATATIIDTQQS